MLRSNFKTLLIVVAIASSIQLSGAFAQDNPPIDTSTFDQNVRPQDDLFLYVNGTWLKETAIPDDKSNYGSFGQLADLSESRIKELIEDIAKETHNKGSNEQKVGDFFNAFMNEELANEKGWSPIEEELKAIDAIESKQALFERWAHLGVMGVGSPAGLYVSQDAKVSSQYIVHLTQSGLTLPDRDYYLKDDDKSSDARLALLDYIKTVFELTDIAEAETSAAEILDFETELAKVTWARVELRDANKRYNKYDADKLASMTPSFDWKPFFTLSEIGAQEEVIVNTPSFFEGFQDIADETSLDVMKQYTKFRIIDAFANYLSVDYVNAHFELYDSHLGDIPSQKPRSGSARLLP